MGTKVEAVLEMLAAELFKQHEEIDAKFSRTIKSGPRCGQVTYDDRYNHGYRDALEDTRMGIQDALEASRMSDSQWAAYQHGQYEAYEHAAKLIRDEQRAKAEAQSARIREGMRRAAGTDRMGGR